jgi:hypothetical protein
MVYPTAAGPYFNFQYDDALSMARGQLLAAELMKHCDDDLSLLVSWFSGSSLDMSPPIHVSIISITSTSDPNIGGAWQGAGPVPLQVTLGIGELAVSPGTPIMLARHLLISEVSEMYMRGRQPFLFNAWFASQSEGSKGEGLSRFLSTQFLLKTYPGLSDIPSVAGGFNVTDRWLNSARDNHIEDNVDDIKPDAIVGCATLFLFYLHDQLGFTIEQIINAGAGRLANVYENLTGDGWTNAWPKFSGLVNAHCPATRSYFPPFDTVFPVSNLKSFTAPAQISWVPTGGFDTMGIFVDHPAKVPLDILVTSDDPTVIPSAQIVINPRSEGLWAPLRVRPQQAGFAGKTVTLTASYAGASLTSAIEVIAPNQLALPALEITANVNDPCQPVFIAGSPERFVVKTLRNFRNQTGLVFAWTVTGAAAGALNAAELTIDSLPTAGTQVTLSVTVTNGDGVHASGTLRFTTLAVNDAGALTSELRCRLGGLRLSHPYIPAWEPREISAGVLRKELTAIQAQVKKLTIAAERTVAVIKKIEATASAAEAQSRRNKGE